VLVLSWPFEGRHDRVLPHHVPLALRHGQRLEGDPEFRSLVFLVFLTLVGGTIFYTTVEGWSVVDAFYFSLTMLTTVGLGDLAPETTRWASSSGLSIHLRGSQHNLGVHSRRGKGDLEPPDTKGRQ
jgi:hypothetical protein